MVVNARHLEQLSLPFVYTVLVVSLFFIEETTSRGVQVGGNPLVQRQYEGPLETRAFAETSGWFRWHPYLSASAGVVRSFIPDGFLLWRVFSAGVIASQPISGKIVRFTTTCQGAEKEKCHDGKTRSGGQARRRLGAKRQKGRNGDWELGYDVSHPGDIVSTARYAQKKAKGSRPKVELGLALPFFAFLPSFLSQTTQPAVNGQSATVVLCRGFCRAWGTKDRDPLSFTL